MTIDQRLADLEQKNRRLSIAMIALFCGLALVVGLNVSIFVNKLVQTRGDLAALRRELKMTCASQKFLLLDEKGNHRGYLSATEGQASLTLMDDTGHPRIVADAGEKEPLLELLSKDGQPKVSLRLDPEGNRLLIHASKPNRSGSLQAVVNSSGPTLRLLGDAGEEIVSLP